MNDTLHKYLKYIVCG